MTARTIWTCNLCGARTETDTAYYAPPGWDCFRLERERRTPGGDSHFWRASVCKDCLKPYPAMLVALLERFGLKKPRPQGGAAERE